MNAIANAVGADRVVRNGNVVRFCWYGDFPLGRRAAEYAARVARALTAAGLCWELLGAGGRYGEEVAVKLFPESVLLSA